MIDVKIKVNLVTVPKLAPVWNFSGWCLTPPLSPTAPNLTPDPLHPPHIPLAVLRLKC